MEVNISREDLPPVTESKYILAKYRIQVVAKEEISEEVLEALPQDSWDPDHLIHPGPKALDYNVDGGKFRCNRDTCMQVLWCFFLPCYCIRQVMLELLNKCCDCTSYYFTELEEKYTLKYCCGCRCCKLTMK